MFTKNQRRLITFESYSYKKKPPINFVINHRSLRCYFRHYFLINFLSVFTIFTFKYQSNIKLFVKFVSSVYLFDYLAYIIIIYFYPLGMLLNSCCVHLIAYSFHRLFSSLHLLSTHASILS